MEKFQNLLRVDKAITSVRGSFFAAVNHDSGAAFLQDAKRIFVGHIVPYVDGSNRLAIETQLLHQPEYGAALVPLDVGLQFEHLLAVTLAKSAVALQDVVDLVFNHLHLA